MIYMCGALMANLRVVAGTSVLIDHRAPLPADGPILFISNHQSMYDVALINWSLRQYDIKYIAKEELGHGLPGISLPLRRQGHLLIDRSNRHTSVRAINTFGAQINQEKRCVCIFPEGTRAPNGQMKPFRSAGLISLLKAMPDAAVVPVAVDGTWRLQRYDSKPVPFGMLMKLTTLEPLKPGTLPDATLVIELERRIKAEIELRAGK